MLKRLLGILVFVPGFVLMFVLFPITILVGRQITKGPGGDSGLASIFMYMGSLGVLFWTVILGLAAFWT